MTIFVGTNAAGNGSEEYDIPGLEIMDRDGDDWTKCNTLESLEMLVKAMGFKSMNEFTNTAHIYRGGVVGDGDSTVILQSVGPGAAELIGKWWYYGGQDWIYLLEHESEEEQQRILNTSRPN